MSMKEEIEQAKAAHAKRMAALRKRAAAEQRKIDAKVLAALRERHYGSFQALTYDEARIRFPDDYHRFETRDPEFTFPEGGESLRQFAARIRRTLASPLATQPSRLPNKRRQFR